MHEEWLEVAATKIQRVLIIQSVTDLDRCDDELITRLATLVRKEVEAADKEAREGVRGLCR